MLSLNDRLYALRHQPISLDLDGVLILIRKITWIIFAWLGFYLICFGREVVSLNPAHGEVYSIQHYVIKFVSDLQQVDGFLPSAKMVAFLGGLTISNSEKKKTILIILYKII
jgi:hypothetical protein